MTTTRSPSSPGDTLPAALPRGELLDAVAYAFSDATTGTMSASVGAGDHVANRARLAGDVCVSAEAVAWMHQVHGDDVIDPGPVPDQTQTPAPASCDGMVSGRSGRALAVLVADCIPVLLAAPWGVGVAHSGRAGTERNIAGTAVNHLLALSDDTEASALTALLGPAIGGCCYEVPVDLVDRVAAAVPGTASLTTWGTPSLDLVGAVAGQLQRAGVRDIRRVGGCTRCAGDGRWFSHRASGEVEARPAGRQAGIIVRRPTGGS